MVACLLIFTLCISGPQVSPHGPTIRHANLPNTSGWGPNVFNPGESLPPTWISPGGLNPLPNLYEFIAQVMNHDQETVRGVYVPGIFALPVVQQPGENYSFVSTLDERVTQFGRAALFDVIGLLAHNYLSGKHFYQLVIGQPVIIVMGDGTTRHFTISEISGFQRIRKPARLDEFIDVISGKKYSSLQVFNRFYNGYHHLTFQTCLEKDGDLDWGLYFVVAQPAELVHTRLSPPPAIVPR
jgi:hypothetical protein